MASWSAGLETVSWIFWSNAADMVWGGLTARQDLGQMHRPYGQIGAGERSAQLHEAARIDRYDGVGAGANDGLDFGTGHGSGELLELHRKRASESTALFGYGHFAQFESADVPQQPSRALFDFELPQRVAAIVIGDDVVQLGPDVF